MQRINGELVLSPTDLTKHLACAHVTTLDLAVADGTLRKPELESDELELIFRLGIEHEERYYESLRASVDTVVEIPTRFDAEGRRAAEAETLAAMQSGADVIYQATFFDEAWGGQADFLLKRPTPSNLGDWSYEIADTKLARKLKVPALLQMANYADRLETLQGVAPERLYVVTGDGEEHPWRLVDVAAYTRRAQSRLRQFIVDQPSTDPVHVGYCGQCRWLSRCAGEWRANDDLTLVAFMNNSHRQLLVDHGISTVAGLGGCDPEDLPRSIGVSTRERLVQQAREQLKERATGEPSYLLLPPVHHAGLLRLPLPDDGDLYLDFEGDPYADEGKGREYLAGLGDRADDYFPLWAHDPAAERQLTIDLIDRLLNHWRMHPQMHVYHYAPYETTALKKLAARHGVREAQLDQLLRGERFVDLYAVVRQGMRISKESYSIKKMEAFYWQDERNKNEDVADALASVVAYEKWSIERSDQTILDSIEGYNRDDVRSTHDLHVWLEERRDELVAQYGSQPRPEAQDANPERPPSDTELAEIDLADRLRESGHELLADLVQWHRREARPEYWDFFRLRDLHEEDFESDRTALGPLSSPVYVGDEKQSKLWRYEFPPQETAVREGSKAHNAGDGKAVGDVFEIDPVAGYVILKRQGEPATPVGVGPPPPIGDSAMRKSIAKTGEDLLVGLGGLPTALIDRRVPTATERLPGETAQQAVVRIGLRLDHTVLAVQGPPGSGKSRTGAELIRQLLDMGKRVGVTANSHSVIGYLLRTIDRPALQKCSASDAARHSKVVQIDDNKPIASALAAGDVQLVGGTAWMWARPEFEKSVDVMVIEEAGQFSLANAVAVARAAESMVLLGDPQQLPQPIKGLHPEGARASALGHLLDDHKTMPIDRGVFLDLTWRMHPRVTAFVSDLAYEGLLHSGPGRDNQEVRPGGPLYGSGLRLIPVDHVGRAARSPEEAAVVDTLWRGLVGQTFVDVDKTERPISPEDVLIVAPFNSQVAEIKRRLPDARVGTVDKFQGQEAPIVLYSMTSSTAADAPRGVDFLYDIHRLNVAVSRAQALAVIVCNPALLDAPVGTPEQLRRVNALCRFAELAPDSGS